MDWPEKYFAAASNIQDCCNFSSNLSRQAGGHSQAEQSHLCLGGTQEMVAQLLKLPPDCLVLRQFYPRLNPFILSSNNCPDSEFHQLSLQVT